MKCRITSLAVLLGCLLLSACAETDTRPETRGASKPQIDGLSDDDVVVKSASVSEATVKAWLRQAP
jgi:hypothetical protein